MPELDVAQYARDITPEHYHPLLDKFTNNEDKLLVLSWIQRALREEVARTDEQTGFLTATAWRQELESDLEENPNNIAVAVIDVTNFKALNDALGQDEGDLAIVSIANHIAAKLGGKLGRLGGDEFAVIIDITPRDYNIRLTRTNRISVLNRRFQEDTEQLHDDNPQWRKEFGLDLAVGIATPAENEDGARLLRKAELAMKRQKAVQHQMYGAYRPKRAERS